MKYSYISIIVIYCSLSYHRDPAIVLRDPVHITTVTFQQVPSSPAVLCKYALLKRYMV